jgi:hypothetical protein
VPGYAQYVDVETDAKMLSNMVPSDAEDVSKESWGPISGVVANLKGHVDSLVGATTGSQKKIATELQGIVDQLVHAVMSIGILSEQIPQDDDEESKKKAHDLLEANGPTIATTRAALRGLINKVHEMDEKKLKAKRFAFS